MLFKSRFLRRSEDPKRAEEKQEPQEEQTAQEEQTVQAGQAVQTQQAAQAGQTVREEQAVQEEQTEQERQAAQIARTIEYLEDELDIDAGLRVDILTMQNRLLFVGRLERYRAGTMTISDAQGNELPPLVYNSEMRLRFVRNGESVVLQGKVCGSSDRIMRVDRLERQFTKEKRVNFRQRLSTNPPATCYRRAEVDVAATDPVRCEILDVSAGGLLIRCEEDYNLGDCLVVEGISIAENEGSFNFTCEIRRVGEKINNKYRDYGCQFEGVSEKEEDRLLRAIFAAQREEIRRQRARSEAI